jgi:multidrug efflux pump subunit AcrB
VDLNLYAFVGVMMLVGIAKKNAIVNFGLLKAGIYFGFEI